MEYRLNQIVKIINPWSGSPFKKGDFAIIRGVFQTDSECSVMYVLEGVSSDYMHSLYPSEFTPISTADFIRIMDDYGLAHFLAVFLCESGTTDKDEEELTECIYNVLIKQVQYFYSED